MKTNRSAFSLIELLVVIAIIATLMSISILYLSGAKSRAKGIECQKNLGDWAKGLGMFIDESRIHKFPNPGSGARDDANAWYNVLAKHLDIRPLSEYGEEERLPGPQSGIKSMYVCPLATKGDGDKALFSYAANAFFEKDNKALRAANVHDASAFIVFMDAPKPTECSATCSQVLESGGAGSFRHGGRMNAAFLDGSVRSLDPRQVRTGSDDLTKISEANIYWDAFPE